MTTHGIIYITINHHIVLCIVRHRRRCKRHKNTILSHHIPLRQNFFIFMQFSGKIGQIVCWSPLWGWCPLLWEILDPTLSISKNKKNFQVTETYWSSLHLEELSHCGNVCDFRQSPRLYKRSVQILSLVLQVLTHGCIRCNYNRLVWMRRKVNFLNGLSLVCTQTQIFLWFAAENLFYL